MHGCFGACPGPQGIAFLYLAFDSGHCLQLMRSLPCCISGAGGREQLQDYALGHEHGRTSSKTAEPFRAKRSSNSKMLGGSPGVCT